MPRSMTISTGTNITFSIATTTMRGPATVIAAGGSIAFAGEVGIILDSPRPEPRRLEPARLGSPRPEPRRLEPRRLEPARLESLRLEPRSLEPRKLEPARLEPRGAQ